MKISVLVLFAFIIMTITLSCGSGESSSTTGEEPVVAQHSSASGANLNGEPSGQTGTIETSTGEIDSDEVPPEEIPVVYLELCYATSTGIPEELCGPEKVFDGDSSTYWTTMPGAAPDEGLYFSFAEPIEIESIIIEAVPGSEEFEEIELVQLYVNGLEGAARSPGSPIWSYGSVRSVFVKIVRTESMSRTDMGIRYQRDLPVAISEIKVMVMDKNGDAIPMRIVPIAEVGGSVEASSSLEPVEAYGPDFLFDSRLSFGWADGNDGRTGEVENLTINFDEPQRIEKLKIWNGYHRSREHFDQNERAEVISFAPSGEEPSLYELPDTMEPQIITLDFPLEVSSYFLDFVEIYPGETYRDLVISELHFFDGEEWFVIDSGGSETRKRSILEWAQNTHAGAFIDRQLYADFSDDYRYDEQTLVIRSNSSFVIWKNNSHSDTRERMYADGNWQILDDSTIRIFGRMHRLASYDQDSYDPYAGRWSDQEERLDRMTIFSDTLKFGEDWISSSRALFEDFTF